MFTRGIDVATVIAYRLRILVIFYRLHNMCTRGIDVATAIAYRYCTCGIIDVIVAAAIALDHFLDSIISQVLFTLK